MLQETIDRVLHETDEFIIAAMNKYTLPGLAVGIVRDGRLVYAKGFGLADAKAGRAVTADTVFRIASISKTFTAIGLMQLWEQGKFQLDDPVNDYLVAYKVQHRDPQAPPVTFRHLLTHTSGIGEFRTISDLFRFRRSFIGVREGESLPTLREYYGGRLTPELYPEEKWAYANHGFATVGQLVEDISGEPFAQYMREHVFSPLGMERTDFLRSDRVCDELAVGYQGYQLKRGRLKPVDYLENILRPASEIFSSVNEMARYVAALMNGGRNEYGAVLKPETLQMMMEPHYRVDERLTAMGLAFWLEDFDGHRIAWHGGEWPGFTSAMYVAPDDGLGIVVFTNVTSIALFGIAASLMRRLLDVPDPVSQLPRPDILETPHLWADLCGFYGPKPGFLTNARIWMMFGGEAEVFVKGNHLALRSLAGLVRKGIPLYPSDPSDPLAFQVVYENLPISVVFKRNEAGQIDRLLAGAMGPATLYKRPTVESLRFRVTAVLAVLASLVAVALGWRRLRKC